MFSGVRLLVSSSQCCTISATCRPTLCRHSGLVVPVAILCVVAREDGWTLGYRESLSDSCGAVKLGSRGGVGWGEGYVLTVAFVAEGLGVDSFFGAEGDFFQKRMKLVFFFTIGSG